MIEKRPHVVAEDLYLPRCRSSRFQERFASRHTERKCSPFSQTNNAPGKEACTILLLSYPANSRTLQHLSTSLQENNRKRARPEETAKRAATPEPPRKRPRVSAANLDSGVTSRQSPTDKVVDKGIDRTKHWIQHQRWPAELFKQADQTSEDYDKDSRLHWKPVSNMNHLLRRKKSSLSLRRTQSIAGSVAPSSATPSDQRPREVKSAPYQDARYESILEGHGSFMRRSELGVKDTSKADCRTLLETKQTYPADSLFCDEMFEEICETVRNKNEARIVRDISPLIVPSAETLAIREAKRPKLLIESVNEGWNNSDPITKTRPQPDYSVGFRKEAFTDEQLKRLEPFVGDLTDASFFMATYYMYFPFLTCEVKCGTAALDVADRQNAHSMTMAVRGVVELFRLAKREPEIHQQILAFSISHDHRTVRIYGHYPAIDGEKTTFYRHPVRTFDFTELDGREKWTAYQFTRNVYDIWMPAHFKRICSVIDELPDFGVPLLSGLQDLESRHLSDYSSHDPTSPLDDAGSVSSHAESSRGVTPDPSLSQRSERASKKLKRRLPEELQ